MQFSISSTFQWNILPAPSGLKWWPVRQQAVLSFLLLDCPAYPEGEDSSFFQCVCKYLLDFMDSHPRRQYFSSYKLICHKVVSRTSKILFSLWFLGNHMGDTVTFWLPSSETSVLFQGSHCLFCSMQSAIRRAGHRELNFFLLITIPPLLSIHLSLSQICD
jgi:hypothetical protein